MGTKSRRRHNRKKRRDVNKIIKFGKKASARHTCRSGRTGTAHSKKMRTLAP